MRVADVKHPHRQLRIDSRTTALAVERAQLLANAEQIDEASKGPQQVVR